MPEAFSGCAGTNCLSDPMICHLIFISFFYLIGGSFIDDLASASFRVFARVGRVGDIPALTCSIPEHNFSLMTICFVIDQGLFLFLSDRSAH